jgi:imidazolonepropionase-like amidohydrolase
MGVEAVLLRAFSRAGEYQREWTEYEARRARGEDPDLPRRDLRLDVLAGILKHEVLVHSHCYRADEILMLLRASQRFGFKIATLQHVLEGYKVAKEMADLGVGGSTFGDWWAYKIEAYDAIPQNAALMDEAGVLASVNSDSAEMMRRLYGEAAKSVRYAGMDPVRALALATINPARQLGIDERVGSIEKGKDADLVLLSGEPLSSLARVRWTMVDGEIEFERRDAYGLDSNPPTVLPIEEPAPKEIPKLTGDMLVIAGGTLHPITSPDIEGGTILIQGGRILAMGRGLPIPAGARTIQAQGKHVWPGMIALGANTGLLEVGSIASTDDQGDIGGNQPDLRVSASINADSAHIGVTRSSGITRSQTTPQRGGPLLGQSAIVRLAGDTWEEMLQVDRDMLHLRFPSTANDAKEKKEGDEVKELRRFFDEALEYGRLSDLAGKGEAVRPAFDPRLESLVPYARAEKKVAVHADNAQTILFALKFAQDEKLSIVLYGAQEGWKVAEELAKAKVPVVVGPVIALPTTRFDPYDASFANPAVLARAGVPIAIIAQDAENERNLPFHAAMAAAFGLPREEALRAITYSPARILGIERELGSLAPGKIADLIVTDGDLLEYRTRVEALLIDGVQVDVSNRQTRLYRRYRDRLHRLNTAIGGREKR